MKTPDVKSIFVFLITLMASFNSLASTFVPRASDIKLISELIAGVNQNARLIVVADYAHRSADSRAVSALVVQLVAEKYPEDNVCLFLETTSHIDRAWKAFKREGTFRSHAKNFGRVAKKVARAGNIEIDEAARVFVEPDYITSDYIRRFAINADVYGVDVDYTDKKVFAPLYKNMNPGERKMKDEDYAKILLEERNEKMARQIEGHYAKGRCQRGILVAGSGHILNYSGDGFHLPSYKGPEIAGVPGRIRREVTGELVVLGMGPSDDESRSGMLRKLPASRPEFIAYVAVPEHYLKIRH